MKIIGVVGSARHGANTATLVEKVLEGARARSAAVSEHAGTAQRRESPRFIPGTTETVLYYVDDLEIGPCQACESCKQTAVCVQHDGMGALYQAIQESRGLVLGTPIYLDHVSAQTKIFLDRLYAYLGPNLENHFPPGYKAVVVVTWGDGDPHAYDDVITWIQRRLSGYWDIETVAVVAAPNADARPMREQPDRLQEALAAGVKLVESLA